VKARFGVERALDLERHSVGEAVGEKEQVLLLVEFAEIVLAAGITQLARVVLVLRSTRVFVERIDQPLARLDVGAEQRGRQPRAAVGEPGRILCERGRGEPRTEEQDERRAT